MFVYLFYQSFKCGKESIRHDLKPPVSNKAGNGIRCAFYRYWTPPPSRAIFTPSPPTAIFCRGVEVFRGIFLVEKEFLLAYFWNISLWGCPLPPKPPICVPTKTKRFAKCLPECIFSNLLAEPRMLRMKKFTIRGALPPPLNRLKQSYPLKTKIHNTCLPIVSFEICLQSWEG